MQVPVARELGSTTFSFSQYLQRGHFRLLVALLVEPGRAGVFLLGSWLCPQTACLPGCYPSLLPLSLMSQSFAQFPPLPMKPFQSLPSGRAPSLAEVLEHVFGTCHLYCFTWWMLHYCVLESAPPPMLSLPLSSGLLRGSVFILSASASYISQASPRSSADRHSGESGWTPGQMRA